MFGWDNDKVFGRREEYSVFNAASLALYFFLILTSFAALQFACNLLAFANTAASVLIIFPFILFLLRKLQILDLLKYAGS